MSLLEGRRASKSQFDDLMRRISVAKPWQTNTALLLVGMGLLLLCRQLVNEYDHFTMGFSGVGGWSVILYLLAAFLVVTQPVDRYTFPLILAIGIVCRLAVLYGDPYMSSDIYRYVWDGTVQHAHISPYRFVPGDPALSFLREPNQYIFDNINRRDYARTIYPPAAQLMFYLITFLSPTMLFMKTAMVLFEGLTVLGIVRVLSHLGERREMVLLYAWCPLILWEIAGSGHLDSVAMAYVAFALLFRYREKPVLTGVFLGLAVMTKFYPLVLFPALYRRGDWKMPTTLASVVAVGYAAYSSVGVLAFGFVGGYVQEEGMVSGSRYFLLELGQRIPGLKGIPMWIYLVFVAVVFAALSGWAWVTCCRKNSERGSFLPVAFSFATALMLLFSPHYAWYIAWLVPFFAIQPNLPILAYLAGFFYLFTTALAEPGEKMFILNEILYGLVLVGCIVQLLLRRWPVHRRVFHDWSAVPEKRQTS